MARIDVQPIVLAATLALAAAAHANPLGETTLLATLPGPGEIRHMWFTIAGRDRRYPRTPVLRIYWDGAEHPSVETPIAEPFDRFPPVAERVNPQIVLETADMADAIRTSAEVTVERQSNRVSNLKRALYAANTRVGGWFEIPCRIEDGAPHSISVFQCLYRTGGI